MGDRGDFSLKFYFIFNLLMIFLYAFAGIMVIFVWHPAEMLPDLNRNAIGIVLIMYAAYRSFRLYKKKRVKNITSPAHE